MAVDGRRLLTLILAFAGMVLGIEGIRAAIDWWHSVLPAPTLLDYVSITSLPLLGWLWWRYLSPFARGRGQCLQPGRADKQREDDRQSSRQTPPAA